MGNQPLNCRQYCGGDKDGGTNADLSKPGNPIFEPFYDNIHNHAQIHTYTPDDLQRENIFEQIKARKSSDLGNTLEIVNNAHAPPVATARLLQSMPTLNNIRVESTYRKIGRYQFIRKDTINNSLPVLGPFELNNGAIYIGQWKYGTKYLNFLP
jgi:hypothetical protein